MGSSSRTRGETWAPALGVWNLNYFPGHSAGKSQASVLVFFFSQGADHDLHTLLSGIPLLVSAWDTQGKPEWSDCGWFTQDFWAPLLGCVNPLKAK